MLRRLRADHKDLAVQGLPPNYLHPPDDFLQNTADDLNELNVLLVGPEGTPYSQGIWRVQLIIPDDYPKHPPKASFRSRIWHPNVEENTGHICVETLKRDWESKLTLRHILLTISCLLINPNPDSALNSTAGRLLQEDYESFARQARLMTSIHARISPDLEYAAHATKSRGDDVQKFRRKDMSNNRDKYDGVAKRLDVASAQEAEMDFQRPEEGSTKSTTLQQNYIDGWNRSMHDEEEAAKENLGEGPTTQMLCDHSRRAAFSKRPLSDLPIAQDLDTESDRHMLTSLSERNISANLPHRQPDIGEHIGNKSSRAKRSMLDEPSTVNAALGLSNVSLETEASAKRVCLDESRSKEIQHQVVTTESTALADSLCVGMFSSKRTQLRQNESVSGQRPSNAKFRKPRTGLRRL
ncbi:MAG: hypothetical protein Q9183_000089 [Haloplaca sp. 2 TL-2023]